MGLGVLQDHSSLERVPGTVILDEEYAHSEEITANLKHGTGRSAHIVLVPQPSDDPNDPLNWPYWKRLSIMAILVYGGCLFAAVVGPLLSSGQAIIAVEFGRTIADLTLLSGYQLLVAACSGPIISAFSRKYGKRPTFLMSTFFGLLGTIIGSATDSYDGLLAARIIQGGSICAYEAIVYSIIGDIFFVHERGLQTSIVTFTMTAVSNLAGVVTGPIVDNLGWKYLFHILVACSAFQLVLLFLFVPETTYHRDMQYNLDEIDADIPADQLSEKQDRSAVTIESAPGRAAQPRKKSFWQELAVYTGSHSDENFLQLVVAPILCCLNLAAFWMVVVVGMVISFYVAVSYVAAQIFSAPPYLLTAAGVGYVFLGPFIGGILGSILLGFTNDPLIIWCTKRNGGIYEPEFRLIQAVLGLFCGAGLVGFGCITQNKDAPEAAAFMWGMQLFGTVFLVSPISSYVIDSYREMSSEVFIASMVFKNFMFYAYSYFVNNWTAMQGPREVFCVFGGIAFGLALTTIVVYIFGKRYRSFWHRHNLLKMLHVQTHAEM
ncbi:major facilitator superfamily domain-containing protein [Lineolata rhizophorae]|uniref:Major facilitator superfamily domain-containing protein n=1 Tax=Lineolata rhizophorae TaxID=578093 RepID=A0A6A6PF67_9PEZI|nr:major facilitator superfamily domain-containing protein [Lineolata rhizophorae]